MKSWQKASIGLGLGLLVALAIGAIVAASIITFGGAAVVGIPFLGGAIGAIASALGLSGAIAGTGTALIGAAAIVGGVIAAGFGTVFGGLGALFGAITGAPSSPQMSSTPIHKIAFDESFSQNFLLRVPGDIIELENVNEDDINYAEKKSMRDNIFKLAQRKGWKLTPMDDQPAGVQRYTIDIASAAVSTAQPTVSTKTKQEHEEEHQEEHHDEHHDETIDLSQH